jgi:hypothetical protein
MMDEIKAPKAVTTAEKYLAKIAGEDIACPAPVTTIEKYLAKIAKQGGSGGTTDYTDLENKPKINNVELSGNKSSSDLGLQDTISDLAAIRSNASAGAGAAAKVTGITETGNDHIKMGNGINITFSATAPSNPSAGDIWFGG